jgi:hypothetical protein
MIRRCVSRLYPHALIIIEVFIHNLDYEQILSNSAFRTSILRNWTMQGQRNCSFTVDSVNTFFFVKYKHH